ncbi:MOSC N-terminal beta barrel domain-containing protein [Alcaligenaceae bacterium CGII-47]|nr:MOSC N-terminal beta barrel domain-containing protein [Alcaligenaceae bacterium CGII-47]
MHLSIRSLYSYPIKSCAGIPHEQALIHTGGLEHDRHWVIVDAQGVFMTQRQVPRMVLIQPTLSDQGLMLRAPGVEDFVLPIAQDKEQAEATRVPVTIWGTPTLGADEGDEVARWLLGFLGIPCRLLRQHPQAQRIASLAHVQSWRARHADNTIPERHAFAFADGFPFLVTNYASLQELNHHLDAKGIPEIDMIRFRPNIVLDGLPAYDEDYLAGFRTGACTFAIVKPCARCPIPNVDPTSGLTAAEPGLTLAEHRLRAQGVLFGVNAVISPPAAGTYLRVGDTIELDYDI